MLHEEQKNRESNVDEISTCLVRIDLLDVAVVDAIFLFFSPLNAYDATVFSKHKRMGKKYRTHSIQIRSF